MDIYIADQAGGADFFERIDETLSDIGGLVEDEYAFPVEALHRLTAAGLLATPLSRERGGQGIGTEPARAEQTFALLRRIGRASLSLGRVFEGHLNAIRLVQIYGTTGQMDRVAADVLDGNLYGLWITDAPGTRATLDGNRLHGRKSPASAAGHATRALITVERRGEHLALFRPSPDAVGSGRKTMLQGMRATGTGSVTLDGTELFDADIVGRAGDYMRQPEISLGAWRTLAVIMGGLDALVAETRAELVRRDRHTDPHQLARMGQLAISHETARLWLARTATLAEGDTVDPEDAANYVKLARIAVETASLDTIRLAQRALGIAAFVQPHPVERLCRDLATYLRQPALDMVLDEAALHFAQHPLP